MPCQSCAQRRAAMKAYTEKALAAAAHWAKVRMGVADAQSTTDVQAEPTERAEAQAQGSGQAGNTPVQHGQQGVAGDPPVRAGSRRVSVSGVRKAGSRKGGAR